MDLGFDALLLLALDFDVALDDDDLVSELLGALSEHGGFLFELGELCAVLFDFLFESGGLFLAAVAAGSAYAALELLDLVLGVVEELVLALVVLAELVDLGARSCSATSRTACRSSKTSWAPSPRT